MSSSSRLFGLGALALRRLSFVANTLHPIRRQPRLLFSTNGSGDRASSEGGKKMKKKSEFSVDISGLGKVSEENLWSKNIPEVPGKECLTELGREIQRYIQMRGPITVHEYMSLATNHAILGYYRQKNEKIGHGGDFITSPEISQIFGEMVAIWCVSVWEAMSCPPKITLCEMGPGTGALMKDMLRCFEKFPKFKSTVSVVMIELSKEMQHLQQTTLLGKPLDEPSISSSKDEEMLTPSGQCGMTPEGVNITWYPLLREVPRTEPILCIGQEFLDAFPVHQFVYTTKGWRERLVDIDVTTSSTTHFRFVVSPNITPAVTSILRPASGHTLRKKVSTNELPIVSGGHDMPLNKSQVDKSSNPSGTSDDNLKAGDGLEISPLALASIEDVAMRLKLCGGAALFFDYGERFTQQDSLRGFQKHVQKSVLSEPGLVDITADVDFIACESVARRAGVRVEKTVTQGEFLVRMGAVSRVEQLLSRDDISDEQAEVLVESFRKIVDETEMGARFKVLGFSNINADKKPTPAKDSLVNLPGFSLEEEQQGGKN